MFFRRLMALAVVAVVVAVAVAAGADQEIKVTVVPERLPAFLGNKAKVTVKIDVATSPSMPPRIDFSVKVSRGTVTPSQFTVEQSSGEKRAVAEKELEYQFVPAPDQAGSQTLLDLKQPSEVLISIEGCQGICLEGVPMAGTNLYRGLGRLFLTPVSKAAPPADPVRVPPFEPRPEVVNPTGEMLDRAAVVAALLALVAAANYLVTRTSRRKDEVELPTVTITAQDTGFTVVRTGKADGAVSVSYSCAGEASAGSDYRTLPGRVVIPNGTLSATIPVVSIASLAAKKTIIVTLKKHSDYTVGSPDQATLTLDGESKRTSEWVLLANPKIVEGNGRSRITLTLSGEAPENYSVRKISFRSDRPDYKVSIGEDNLGGSVDKVPWEWNTVSVVFTAVVNMKPLSALKGGAALPDKSAHASCTVRVIGADPRIVVETDPARGRVIHATGQDGIDLKAQLWLFGEPAPESERIHFVKATGLIDGKPWDKEPLPEQRNARATHPLSGSEAWLTWVPPFLVGKGEWGFPLRSQFEERDFQEEVVLLEAQCEWSSGSLYDLAKAKPGMPQPIPTTKCEVMLRGCAASSRPLTEWFTPLPDTPLYAQGRITDQEGRGVNPFSRQSVSRDQAKIRCEVRDLSQGLPDFLNGCKLPPKHGLDPGFLEVSAPDKTLQVEAAIQKASLVNTVDIVVDMDGQLCSRGEGDSPITVVAEQNGPPGPKTLRIDGPERAILLWKYQLNQGPTPWEPIHMGSVVYLITIDDGFGGKVTLQGACRAALGSLVLETGGPDFRIYENHPFCFEVQYRPGAGGYRPEISDRRMVQLSWQFALVDRAGKPRAFAGAASSSGDIGAGRYKLVVGHMRKDRDICVHRETGEVRHPPLGAGGDGIVFPPGLWRQVDQNDRHESAKLRANWHKLWNDRNDPGLKECRSEEPGLPWLVSQGESPWKDSTLSLAVRVEMRLEGNLLATSDRLMETGIRTPPEFVWRDHRFKYVLLMLRLRLQDSRGQPYVNRTYLLTMEGRRVEGNTGSNGLIEQLVEPPDAEKAMLELPLDAERTFCIFPLQLGHLDSLEENSGVAGRLNNVGLFAGAGDAARFERALQRFQTSFNFDQAGPGSRLDENGTADKETRQTLEAVHQMGLYNSVLPPGGGGRS